MALLAGADTVATATKPLLMLLLAGYAVAARPADTAPRLLIAGLLASAVGDSFLEIDGGFLAGMGAFALAHVCYLIVFVRVWMRQKPAHRRVLLSGYAIVWLILLVLLLPGLGDLRIPIATYSLLLTATAIGSAALGLRTGVGGALFLLSDSLIALRLAGWGEVPPAGFWVMATYVAAQYLIATAPATRR